MYVYLFKISSVFFYIKKMKETQNTTKFKLKYLTITVEI